MSIPNLCSRGSCVGFVAAACVAALPVFGQSAQVATTAAAASSTAAGTDSGIPEIIVTAQRRTENLQKSSLAIQVLDQDALARAGVAQGRDLNQSVPGV